MTRVADSSFLIAVYDREDPRRELALERLTGPVPIVVPPEVVAETLGVVQSRAGYEVARTIHGELAELVHVSFADATDPDAVAEVFEEGAGALSWVDAAVVWRCRSDDAEPLSFDAEIEEMADG